MLASASLIVFAFMRVLRFFNHRSARGLSSVSRCAEDAAAMGASVAEKAGALRRPPFQIHFYPTSR